MKARTYYVREDPSFLIGEPDYTKRVTSSLDYELLELYIDKLVDFASEIREHEPTWKRDE